MKGRSDSDIAYIAQGEEREGGKKSLALRFVRERGRKGEDSGEKIRGASELASHAEPCRKRRVPPFQSSHASSRKKGGRGISWRGKLALLVLF